MSDPARLRALRPFAVLTLIGLLIGVASFLGSEDPDPISARPTPDSEAAPSSAPISKDSESVEVAVDPAFVRSPADAEEPREPAPSPVAGTEEDEITIQGRIVLTREDGTEDSTANGSFQCIVFEENIGTPQSVTVIAGTFAFRVPPATKSLRFSDARLGLRRAHFSDDTQVRLPVPTPFTLRAYLAIPLTLRVRDDDSRSDLSDVQIVSTDEWEKDDLEVPDLHTASNVVQAATSPVRIDSSTFESRSLTFFASAPGHAWGRLKVDPTRGGEHSIFLRRGGDLELTVIGATPNPDHQLRLYRLGAESPQPSFESALLTGSPTRITGLLPAVYEIRAEIGLWFKQPRILGKVTQEVVVGTTAFATLTIAPIETPPKLPFRGQLIIPNGWEPSDFGLRIEPVNGVGTDVNLDSSELREVSTNPRVLEFDAGDLEPTLYELELYPLPYSVTHDLVAPGETNFRFELPPPARVIVRLVDRSTGQLALVSEVYWNFERPARVSGGSLEPAEPNDDGTQHEFMAPVGTISLTVMDDGYLPASKQIEVAVGTNEVTIELERACGAILTLRAGTRPILIPEDHEIEMVGLDGVGSVLSTTYDSDGAWRRFTLSHPGRYRVTVADLSSYEPIAPFEIEIPAGTFVEHAIQITPRR